MNPDVEQHGSARTRPLRVIVVAYHAPRELARCLEPLGSKVDVLVVDNSSDAQVREVAQRCGAAYLDPGSNRGFGAGVNVGLRQVLAGPPADVLLLNPDACFEVEQMHALVERLHSADAGRIGALSPRVVDESGADQRVMWPFPSPMRAWVEALGLGGLNRSADFAIGAVLLLRWEAVRDVGLFDERFFLYAEETDWQRRATACGWISAVSPDLVAVHTGAATSSDPARREALFHAGTETYQRKWFGARGWTAYRAAVLVGALPRAILLRGGGRRTAVRRMRIYLRGPRAVAGLGATR